MENGKERELVGELPESLEKDDKKLKALFGDKFPTITSFEENTTVADIWSKAKTGTYKLKGNNGIMELLEETSGKVKNEWDTSKYSIFELVENATDMEIYCKNPNKEELNDWSYIKWSTCLYTFKSKKFKCSEVRYNSDTGRIDKITFEEY